MSKLILVRHAQPVIDPDSPSGRWVLAPEAREPAVALGRALVPFAPRAIFCGDEPKMAGTAETLSEILGLTVTRTAGLSEHARRNTKFADKTVFEAAIKNLFERRDEIVYGEESADMTYARFAAAIDKALAGEGGTLVAVTGGTALSIFLSRRSGMDAFQTWKSLRLPMAFVLDRTSWRIERTL